MFLWSMPPTRYVLHRLDDDVVDERLYETGGVKMGAVLIEIAHAQGSTVGTTFSISNFSKCSIMPLARESSWPTSKGPFRLFLWCEDRYVPDTTTPNFFGWAVCTSFRAWFCYRVFADCNMPLLMYGINYRSAATAFATGCNSSRMVFSITEFPVSVPYIAKSENFVRSHPTRCNGMKLVVVAAAALALVAGSVDVEAHCGECKLDKSGGDKKPGARAKAPEGAEKHGRPLHLARLAVAHFDGLTGEDRTQLIEEARNGDETAQEELEAAVTAGLERVRELLADEKTRRAMCMGIGLGYADMSAGQAIDNVNPDELISVALGQCGIVIDDLEGQINSLLDQPTESVFFQEFAVMEKAH